jgi:threonine dehydratase
MRESIKKKKILKLSTGHTIADGISIKTPSSLTFELVKKYVDEIVLVDDQSIVKTMFLLMERSKNSCRSRWSCFFSVSYFITQTPKER